MQIDFVCPSPLHQFSGCYWSVAKEKEAKERKFYSEFQFTRKEYLHRVDQMYSEEYFGDVEMTKTSSLPKFRAKNKPISSKERIRSALKKEKDAAKEANWITTASSLY